METTTKMIGWSYATSTNAKMAGLEKTGCYSVETVLKNPDRNPPKFLKGFATLEEAIIFAATLPYESDKYCLSNTETVKVPTITQKILDLETSVWQAEIMMRHYTGQYGKKKEVEKIQREIACKRYTIQELKKLID